jgi:hypothetical protein
MILAIILLSGPLLTGLSHAGFVRAIPASGRSAAQSAAANPPAANTQSQTSSQTSAPSTTPASSSGSSAAKPVSTPAKGSAHAHKKKTISADCNAAAASGPAAPNDVSGHSGTPANAANTTAQSTPTNCPPKKIIVRQGGTSEPSIQLEGGAVGNQANQQKDSTTQILGTTEQNLKKLEGRQLTSDQKNMVSQARQFMDQAKNAMNTGDFDRARTLAWKAQLLSEDLIKPEQ